jgi:hypothetical protein
MTTRNSHLAPHTPHPTPHTSHLTPHTSHLTPHTPHPTPHTSHPTPHTPHPTPHTSHLRSTFFPLLARLPIPTRPLPRSSCTRQFAALIFTVLFVLSCFSGMRIQPVVVVRQLTSSTGAGRQWPWTATTAAQSLGARQMSGNSSTTGISAHHLCP